MKLKNIEEIVDCAKDELMFSLQSAVKGNDVDWMEKVSDLHSYMCGVKGSIIHLKDRRFNNSHTPNYIIRLAEYLSSVGYDVNNVYSNDVKIDLCNVGG